MNTRPAFKPNKPRRPGTAPAIISEAVADCGGLKRTAHLLGRTVQSVAYYTDPDAPPRMTVAQALTLTEAGSDGFARQFAAAAGGTFIPGRPSNESLPELTGKMTEAHALIIRHVIEAMADGELTPTEFESIAGDIDMLARFTQQALACARARARESKGGNHE